MMEFMNSVWEFFITPSEMNIQIISFPFSFVEAYINMMFFLVIFNINSNKKSRILYVIIIPIIGMFSRLLIPSPFNVFINFILPFIFISALFKVSFSKALISSICSLAIFSLIGFLILNPYITMLHISSDDLANVPIYKIGYLLLMYSISFIVIFILKRRNLKILLFEDIDKKSKIVIIINFILGFITLIIQICILFYYIDTLPILITFLSFISLLSYLAISIYSLTRVLKLTLTTRKLESAEEYNKTLCILHDSVRGFKHDFDNIVTTIGGYVKTNDMDGLKKYYTELENDCQKVNNLYLLNPEIINNPGIYNLLTSKYHNSESKGIKFNMTFLLDLKKLKMNVYEFARILGILLDNAIEASSECDEKIINVIFREDFKNSRQLIIIENTYNNKDVDTEKIFDKGITGKENHTGLGLWEVRNILNKNNKSNLFTSKTDKFFSQQLELY